MSENKVLLSAGHSKRLRGASGNVNGKHYDEHDEAVKFVNRVVEILGSSRADKYIEKTANKVKGNGGNLDNIVKAHNKKNYRYNISVHFNALNGKAHGTEVFYFKKSGINNHTLATNLSKVISKTLGTTDRGAKSGNHLYVLRNTVNRTWLLEIAFIDNASDMRKYDAKFEELCQSVASVLANALGKPLTVPTKPNGKKPNIDMRKYNTVLPKSGMVRAIDHTGSYDGATFKSSKRLGGIKPGDVFTVVSLTKDANGTPRFKTKSGRYISANKSIFEKVII